MKELKTSIIINATPEKVWKVFLDFDSHPSWNPYIVKIEGKAVVGEELDISLKNLSGKIFHFTPKIVEFIPNQKLEWYGHLFVRGIFSGNHCFEVEKYQNNKTIFKQSESFADVFTPFLDVSIIDETRTLFEGMNKALKEYSEKEIVEI